MPSSTGKSQKILAEKRGFLLSLKPVNARLLSKLSPHLTYEHVEFLRGRAVQLNDGRRMLRTPRQLFVTHKIDDENKQVLIAFGLWPKVRKFLKDNKIDYKIKDNTKFPRPRAYTEYPEKLKDVKWRYRQKEVINLIRKNMCGRLCLPTAFGKSFTIAQLARLYPYAKIHVSTPSLEVITMLYRELSAFLPDVGIYTSKKKQNTKARVMCYSAGSLQHGKGDADFLFLDEVHEFGTDHRLEPLVYYQHAKRFGFSANEAGDRLDNADALIESAVGPELINIPYSEVADAGSIVNLEVWWIPVVMDYSPCSGYEDDTSKDRHGIWRNEYRNSLIAEAAKRFGKDQQVLVTVATLEHAMYLRRLLPDYTAVYGNWFHNHKTRLFMLEEGLIEPHEGELTFEERKRIKEDFECGKLKKVIATPVWDRGVSFDGLRVLVRGDARSSPIAGTQVPGRLSRIDENKDVGILIDFDDKFDRKYRGKSKVRRNHYDKHKWKQQTLKNFP